MACGNLFSHQMIRLDVAEISTEIIIGSSYWIFWYSHCGRRQ